jgi:RNA recognition motif-containing protein
MTIFIRNLPIDVNDEDLKGFFIEFGEVRSARIIKDKFTGFSRRFGYVEMTDEDAANKAIKELNLGKIDGQEIVVMKARAREERKPQHSSQGRFHR